MTYNELSAHLRNKYIDSFCCIAPGGPPQSVSAQPLNSTTLNLAWEPPLPQVQNGVIQQYIIKIIEVDTRMVTNLSTEATSVNVTSLHPYYTYSCAIAAETSGVGPFSSPVVIQLPESGKSSLLT